MKIAQPYTYLIGWTNLDKWYYGVRYANTKTPTDDFWKEYYTSSAYVFEMRSQFGDPDVINIDKVFSTPAEAIAYEHQFLIDNAVLHDKRWLNKNIGGNILITDDVKRKMSLSASANGKNGTHQNSNGRLNKRLVDNGTHNFLGGEMQRATQKERVLQGTHHLLGGDVARSLLANGRHPSQKEYTCPHCSKVGKGNAMKQHHFDKCKFRN